jgi:hypothetical protein
MRLFPLRYAYPGESMSKLFFALLSLAVLAACAPTDPIKHYSEAIDRAHAEGLPILIFKHPADDRLSFINVSNHPIKAVELKLAVCGSGNLTSAGLVSPYWLHVLIKGDFQAGFAFNVKNTKVSAINANGDVLNPNMQGFNWHSTIKEVWVRFADNTPQKSITDSHSLFIPGLSNDCPVDTDAAHGADWLRSLPTR